MRFDAMDVDTIWLDGEYLDWDEANIHVLSHGVHYGTGVFEGTRFYDTERGPAVFRLDDHLERFYDSAAVYGLDIGYPTDELSAVPTELIRRQDLRAGYVRPIALFGYDALGVDPSTCPTGVALAVWPWGSYLGEEAMEQGIDVMVSSWRKHASSQIPTTAKTTGLYVDSHLAHMEAARNGYDEALVLNKDGDVAEGATENLFVVRDGRLATPGLAESILDGITRRSVVTLARELGYEVDDRATVSRGELYTADELFFTGSAAEVTPVRSVDDVDVGDGGRGPVTAELQARFFEVVDRRTDDHDEWFTYVSP